MSEKKRLRINRRIVFALRNALGAARRDRCGVDPAAQDAMRIYLDTWVVARLENALRAIEGQSTPPYLGDDWLSEEDEYDHPAGYRRRES